MDPIREASRKTLEGLLTMIPSEDPPVSKPTSFTNLKWMVTTCLADLEVMPVDKTNRWIGFVQGVLAVRGVLDVNEERNRTRPFFHEAYAAVGQEIPQSRDITMSETEE
jgi:hypothetical protein